MFTRIYEASWKMPRSILREVTNARFVRVDWGVLLKRYKTWMTKYYTWNETTIERWFPFLIAIVDVISLIKILRSEYCILPFEMNWNLVYQLRRKRKVWWFIGSISASQGFSPGPCMSSWYVGPAALFSSRLNVQIMKLFCRR